MTDPFNVSPMVIAQLVGAGRALPSALKLPTIKMVERPPEVEVELEVKAPAPFLPLQSPPINRSFNRSPAARNVDGTAQLFHTLLPLKTFLGSPALQAFSAMRMASFATDPYDPVQPFALAEPFSVAICPTLASYAAARCGW
jgi:hypothetical protein